MWEYSGYPTSSSMRVYVSFTADSAGSYFSYFEVYDAITDSLVTTAYGKTFSMSAGQTISGSNMYKTITGLSSGTRYYIVASLWKDGSRLSINEPVLYFTTLSDGSRPSNWYWSSTVSKGAAMSMTKNGTAIIAKPLTAIEWLNFINRIQQFASYSGVTLNPTYISLSTNGVSSGREMTITQVWAARYLINQLSPPTAVPPEVSSGDTITAAFINGLKNSLNSIT